jgi:hypothetical protein
MDGSIFIVQPDNSLVKVNRTPYNSEALLQGLLSDYPDLLAGDQMNTANPRRWLLVSPELSLGTEADGTGGWWIDHLFLDQDAIPTIVEVKRSTDSRIRREVVGQMLDYAAHLEVYWPAERIRASFEERCRASGSDPDQKVGELLEDVEADMEVFWSRVGENLSIGKMRLLFVADEMPMHLQRVVEFLNKYMSPIEVLAVEIKQFEGSNLKTLVPRVLGQTIQTQQKQAVRTNGTGEIRHWDEERFIGDLSARGGADQIAAAKRVLEWAKPLRIWWGKGTSNGSFYPMLDHGNAQHWTFSIWSYGWVEIEFQYMKNKPPFAQESLRRELALRLSALPGVPEFGDEALSKRPNFRLSVLTDEATLNAFLGTFEWYLDIIRSYVP